MKPLKSELQLFVSDYKSAAIHFKVSEKTVSRWMKIEGLHKAKENYGVKLNLEKAREIRLKHSEGAKIKDLSSQYNVTFSTISRVIHNITYPEIKETAKVKVIYNPCVHSFI
jgi:transposase